MSSSGDGWMTLFVSVVFLVLVWLFVAIGSAGDDDGGGEPACTTAEHCEQLQHWREQDRIDRER